MLSCVPGLTRVRLTSKHAPNSSLSKAHRGLEVLYSTEAFSVLFSLVVRFLVKICFSLLSRSSLNAQTGDLKLNCGEQDFTAAIISIPTPPANTPDESLPPSPAPVPGILRNTRATAYTQDTVKISSL